MQNIYDGSEAKIYRIFMRTNLLTRSYGSCQQEQETESHTEAN